MLKVMYEFMIDIDLPLPFTEEFLSLVPRQRALTNKLMNEGKITSYALSIEEGKLWITVIAEQTEDVREMILSFPIADLIFYKINKLTLHNSTSFQIPNFSLN